MKKRWYDYLWIVVPCVPHPWVLQHPVRLAGPAVLLHPPDHLGGQRHQGLLQSLLRPGPALRASGGPLRPVPKKGHPGLDEKQSLPVSAFWPFFMAMFLLMLWNTYLVFAGAQDPPAGGHSAVDLPAALALGLPRHSVPPRRGPVCLRLLQRHAHLYRSGADHHGAVQAPQLVCLLPHGHHDPAHLQGEGRKAALSP